MKKPVIMLMTMLLALSGCSTQSAQSTATHSQVTSEKQIKIVTSFYPMYISTINVTSNVKNVTVVNMTQPQTGCLHDYELTTEDMKNLETADVFIVNGAGMEQFLDQVKDAYPDLKIIDASEGIELLKDKTGEENPHVWLSIANCEKQVTNIAKGLAEIDPDNANAYTENAKTYNQKLDNVIAETNEAFTKLASKDIVTMHEAFPYYAQEFGLNIAAVIQREPGTEPSPSEIEETVQAIKEANVRAVFTEPQYSDSVAKTLSSETGAKIFGLDPVVTHEADGDKDVYIKLMEKNKDTIVEALK